MIFVDDGVGPRTLQRVLRAVFELYVMSQCPYGTEVVDADSISRHC